MPLWERFATTSQINISTVEFPNCDLNDFVLEGSVRLANDLLDVGRFGNTCKPVF